MITIIIPAHNEETLIGQCLQSILHQPYKDYEIIVICDGCNDNTEKIAKKYTKKVYVVYERNVSAARNYGALKATGEVLVFVDADSIIAPDLLQKIHDTMETKKQVVGGTVRTRSLEDVWKANLLWKCAHIVRSLFYWALPTASGLTFCRAHSFAAVNGFDVRRRLAEDTHLLLALKKDGKNKQKKLMYLDSWIKTSSRRLEKEGYLWTIWRQYFAFFGKGKKGY